MDKFEYYNFEDFKSYENYLKYVNDEWEDGFINELEEEGLIIVNILNSDSLIESVSYRPLTEEEFNKRFK